MREFWDSIKILLAVFGSMVIFGIGLYFTVPSVKDYANTNILKQEQVDTTEKDEQIKTLQAQVGNKAQEITLITGLLEESQARVEVLEAEAQASAEAIAALQASIEEKASTLETVQAEKENLETEKASLEADIEAKQNQIAELESAVEVDAETIATLQKEVATKQQELDSVNAALETKTTEVENLTSQVSTLIQERDDAVNNLSAKQAELDYAQAKVDSFESDLALKEIEIASLNEQITQLESALDIDETKTYISDLLSTGDIYVNVFDDTYYYISGSFTGLYKFNKYDCSVSLVADAGKNWQTMFQTSYGVTLFNNGGSDFLILNADGSYNHVLNINGSGTRLFAELSTGDVAILADYNLHFYIKETGTFTNLYNNSFQAKKIIVLNNDNLLFTGSGYNMFSYTGSRTSPDSTKLNKYYMGKACDYHYVLNNGDVLLSITLKSKIVYYNANEDTFTDLNVNVISTTTSTIRLFYQYGNQVLLYSFDTSELCLLDLTTKTFSKVTDETFSFSSFIGEGSKVKMVGINGTGQKDCYYDFITGEITEVE